MSDAAECERARALLAEVATGALTGQERAMVLGHVAGCATCGRELAALSRVADELLLLAPPLPPPPGFDTAAVERMLATATRPPARLRLSRRWRPVLRFAALAAALLLAVTGGVVTTLWRTAPDRELAEQYREVLTVASGRSVTAATVATESGQTAGHIIVYEGTPSWLMVALTDAPEPGDYTMTVVTDDGYRYTAGICRVVDRSATVGYGLPIAVARVAAIELTKPGVRLIAYPG